MHFFLPVIVHLFPVGLVSRGVNIVIERLEILQDCKLPLYKFLFAPGGPGPGPEASASPASWMIRPWVSRSD